MLLILVVELYTGDFAEIFHIFFQNFALCFHIPIILPAKSAHSNIRNVANKYLNFNFRNYVGAGK